MIEKSKDVPAFVRCCSILVPSVFDDSMSYYEVLCALTKYLKDEVVSVINNNAEVTEQYANAVEELEKYVRDYFKNLDVQEEINNKLDAMAEAGTLQEIIGEYLNANAVWGFDSVADMKSATNLVNGSFARTLGYHSKNDGGSALYKIRTVTNQDSEDDMFIIRMENENLVAELIIESNEIDIRKIGASTTLDIHDYVLAIINKDLDVFIPAGIWKTSPLQIAKYNCSRIRGVDVKSINSSNGTILTPVSNQNYIIKVGFDNTTGIVGEPEISNIMFNTNGFTCTNVLLFSRVQNGKFDEIFFRNCKCSDTIFRVRETWETRLGRIMFRQADAPYAMIFGTKVGSGNISSNYIEFLSFEGCRGTCLKFEENCGYSMNTIDTIDFESGTVAFSDEERVSINVPETYEALSIIETGNGKAEVTIQNFNVNSIAQHAYTNTSTGVSRAYDRMIECKATDTGYYSFYIGTISGVGNINKPILINANKIDKFYCESNIFQGATYFTVNILGCRVYKYQDNEIVGKYLNSNPDGAYRDICVTNNNVSFKGTTGRAVRVATLPCKGNTLWVHARGNGRISYGGSDHITLNNQTDYDWLPMAMASSQVGSVNNLLLGTGSTTEIDDYFFANV